MKIKDILTEIKSKKEEMALLQQQIDEVKKKAVEEWCPLKIGDSAEIVARGEIFSYVSYRGRKLKVDKIMFYEGRLGNNTVTLLFRCQGYIYRSNGTLGRLYGETFVQVEEQN